MAQSKKQLIDKYTDRLKTLKTNMANEDEGRVGGLPDSERNEFDIMIRMTAEVIGDLKTLPE